MNEVGDRGEGARSIRVHAASNADALGYLGQQAVSEAVAPGDDYRTIGGHMVRLLLEVFPTPAATRRSTLDADAAIGDIEVVGPFSESLVTQGFVKTRANAFVKQVGDDQQIEINLLLPRLGHAPGIRPRNVRGVGQVDALPEVHLAMLAQPLILDVTAVLRDGRGIEYRTRVPDVETAVVLKAHSWKQRRKDKDLADLHSLLEIREAHPDVPWRLHENALRGFRKDTAVVLHEIAEKVVRKNPGFVVPENLDRKRLAGLALRHLSRPR